MFFSGLHVVQGGQVDGKFIYSAFLRVNSEARLRGGRRLIAGEA